MDEEFQEPLEVEGDIACYLVGTSVTSPLVNIAIDGVSFERRQGFYDKESRTWSYQEGRVIDLPVKVAEGIRKKAAETFYNIGLFYDEDTGEVTGTKLLPGRGKLSDPAFKRQLARQPYNEVKVRGKRRKKSEWRSLADMIVLQRVETDRGVKPLELMVADLETKEERIRLLEQQLRELAEKESS